MTETSKPEPFDWDEFWDQVITVKRLLIFNLVMAPFVGIGRGLVDGLLS